MSLQELISPRLRDIASLNNPIDLTGSATDEDFMGAAKYLASKKDIDCALVLLLPYSPGSPLIWEPGSASCSGKKENRWLPMSPMWRNTGCSWKGFNSIKSGCSFD